VTKPNYWDIHEAAIERGETIYTDPETGFMVFTSLGLAARGRCCGAGCRHCPYEHEAVPLERRSQRIQQAAWLSEARPGKDAPVTLLFWSGGKDSFLAYRALEREGARNIVLLTTFDARTRVIAHQEFAIDEVVRQAAHLGVPLVGVPLHPGGEYLDHLGPALDLVPACDTLAFGDLHLESIRTWREEAFGGHARTRDLALAFPLWKADAGALLAELEALGAVCTISALAADLPGVSVGDRFDRAFVERLPEGVDPFGENGEFHTLIRFAD
jgi:ATP-binding cassette subfamily B (MDR/TAP) protein 1